jgi:hypothetical protein
MATKKNGTEKISWKPGWNGKPYKGDDWIVANTMCPSRPLTKEEMQEHEKIMVAAAKKSGKNVKVTRDKKGCIRIVFERK